MRKFISLTLLPPLVLALALLFSPPELAAQEPSEGICTATATPSEVPAGQDAVRVTFSFSEAIGIVSELGTPEESAVRLATSAELPRQEMANPENPATPIQMSNEGDTQVHLWLNTADAASGEYEVNILGSEGSCKGLLVVSDPGSL